METSWYLNKQIKQYLDTLHRWYNAPTEKKKSILDQRLNKYGGRIYHIQQRIKTNQ